MTDSGNAKKAGITIGVGVVVVAFLIGCGVGIGVGTKAWRQGCVAEVNLGLKLVRSDCTALANLGTMVDFANSSPLPLAAALKRIADMTSDKDPQRVFVSVEVMAAPFAKNTVHPPTGDQRSLAVVRQLLTEAGALEDVDICIEQSGYFLRVRTR